MMDKIAIVDTTFARFDMGAVVEAELKTATRIRKEIRTRSCHGSRNQRSGSCLQAAYRTRELFDCARVRNGGSYGPESAQRPRSVARLNGCTTPHDHPDSPGVCARD